MKKLLHERLRYIAEGEDTGCHQFALSVDMECEDTDTCTQCAKRVLAAISDEIEKYYIPRPRFEDGELACENDVFVDNFGDEHTISLIEAAFKVWDTDNCFVRYNNLLKRPEKVLDSDGVEIKGGDTVWHVNGSNPWEVCEVTANGILIKDELSVSDGCNMFEPDSLTHREPDSLEKLRDEMLAVDGPVGTITAGKWADRLTAIMERDA